MSAILGAVVLLSVLSWMLVVVVFVRSALRAEAASFVGCLSRAAYCWESYLPASMPLQGRPLPLRTRRGTSARSRWLRASQDRDLRDLRISQVLLQRTKDGARQWNRSCTRREYEACNQERWADMSVASDLRSYVLRVRAEDRETARLQRRANHVAAIQGDLEVATARPKTARQRAAIRRTVRRMAETPEVRLERRAEKRAAHRVARANRVRRRAQARLWTSTEEAYRGLSLLVARPVVDKAAPVATDDTIVIRKDGVEYSGTLSEYRALYRGYLSVLAHRGWELRQGMHQARVASRLGDERSRMIFGEEGVVAPSFHAGVV